ncbi:MAG: hypothetical protein AB7F98_01275 [Novosphingobium sp.]
MVAAAAYAFIAGRKVAGIHDHWSGQDLQIAAESRGNQVQGFDGDRGSQFAATLPELFDGGDNTFVSMEIAGSRARGYDRGTSSHYEADVTEGQVQLYDYSQSAWFAFDVQVAE